MAASHGFQVFRLGFLAQTNSYEMGVPAVPLGALYGREAWEKHRQCRAADAVARRKHRHRKRIVQHVLAGGEQLRADYYVCALPFERIRAVDPGFAGRRDAVRAFAHHRHPSVVRPSHHRSAARDAARPHHPVDVQQERRTLRATGRERVAQPGEMPRAEVIALAVRELAEFFPVVREAKLEKAHVVKEIRATFSAAPGLESMRPSEPHGDPESLPGRRLDAVRVAGHDGRGGPQRVSGGGSDYRGTVRDSGYRLEQFPRIVWSGWGSQFWRRAGFGRLAAKPPRKGGCRQNWRPHSGSTKTKKQV